MRKANGFSIIELIITLAVGAIALTVGLPSYTNMTKNNRLTAQANGFVAAMNLARIEAVKRQADIAVTAIDKGDGDGPEWTNGWVVGGGGFVRRYPSSGGGTLTMVSAGGRTSYTYVAAGRINNAGADALALCDDRSGERGRTISINAVGRVAVTDLACP